MGSVVCLPNQSVKNTSNKIFFFFRVKKSGLNTTGNKHAAEQSREGDNQCASRDNQCNAAGDQYGTRDDQYAAGDNQYTPEDTEYSDEYQYA